MQIPVDSMFHAAGRIQNMKAQFTQKTVNLFDFAMTCKILVNVLNNVDRYSQRGFATNDPAHLF